MITAILNFFKVILYVPLLNALIFLANIIPGHDIGIAIILLTVVVRAILFPLSVKAQRSQRALNAVQPQVQKIREQYKNDQVKQGQAMMDLYKEYKINPIAGCLPLLIQFPIIIALYRAFLAGLNTSSFDLLYSFVHHPATINTLFLGMISVIKSNKILAVLAGIIQFFQARMSTQLMKTTGVSSSNQTAMALNNQMMYILPIMIVIFGWTLPAGLVLYWITTTAWSIGEQFYIRRFI